MKREILVIYDEDEEYIKSFSEYVNNMSNAAFSVAGFTNLDSLLQFVNERRPSLILVSEKLLCEEIIELNIQIMLLSDDGRETNKYEFSEVWKYQPGDNIIREVSSYIAECDSFNSDGRVFVNNTGVKIIAVYSPVRRCGSTSFAISLGQILSESKKVLYLNFEEFSGLRSIVKGEYMSDISDVMYYYIQGNTNMAMRFKAAIHSLQKMDYIPPMIFTEDIRNIDMNTWCSFIRNIPQWSDYDVIVLDIGPMFQNVFEIMSICDRVYVPYVDDSISRVKLEEFKLYLQSTLYGDNLDKMNIFVNQFSSSKKEFDLMEICYGQYREFVKKIAWDVIGNE